MKSLKKSLIRDESGGVAVLLGILMVFLLGCAALAVDLGHLYTVRQELRNAAEAGALAGARALVPFVNLPAPVPYWSNGEAVARQTVQANKGDGALLTNCTVETGWWSLTTNVLQPMNIMTTNADVPAVRVTVRKIEGENSGPVTLGFARVLGFNLADVSASATAMISGSGSKNSGGLFPIAVSEELVAQHWADPTVIFDLIESVYHNSQDNIFGQWTSLLVDENNVPYIRYLEDGGGNGDVSIGDKIYIQPGTEDSLFQTAQKFDGQTVTLPVVSGADLNTHDWSEVKNFASFQIDGVCKTGQKYIKGHFVQTVDPHGKPGGPSAGNFTPPKLVQ